MNDDTTPSPPALHPNGLSIDKSAEASKPIAAQAQDTAPLRVLLRWLGQLRIFEALRYREYRLIWLGQIFASLATWMDQVARLASLRADQLDAAIGFGARRSGDSETCALARGGAPIVTRARITFWLRKLSTACST